MGDDPFRGQRQAFRATFSTTSSVNVVVNPVGYERATLPPQPPQGWPGFQAASGSPPPPMVSRTPSPVQVTRVYPDTEEVPVPRPQFRMTEAYREWYMTPPPDMAEFME
eukprot:4533623-Amphidinium_carterae.1